MSFKLLNKSYKNLIFRTFSVQLFAMFLVALSVVPAMAGDAKTADTWGSKTQVFQYDRFYIAGQPDEDAFEQAQEHDVTVVINLRDESETDWDESTVVESNGMSYYQVPVNARSGPLAEEPFTRISEIVRANPDAEIMVHCGSGNRAAAWLAVYLSEYEGMSADEAIETAKVTGLTNQGLETKTRAFLNQ